MSIYASLPAPAEDHPHACAIYREVEPGVFAFSGAPCDCGLPGAPLVYQGSHVLPEADHERGGYVDLALIPGHVRWYRDHPGRLKEMEDDLDPEPFLRLGVNQATVVLDRAGVELVHRSLGEWLEAAA